MNRLLTTEEVADLLQVPVSTLYQWRYRRKGPPAIQIGRHLRYREDRLSEWIDDQFDTRGPGRTNDRVLISELPQYQGEQHDYK